MDDPRRNWLGLRHVALYVSDVEAARRFYCDFFGMSVEWEPDPDNVYLTSGCDNVALHRGDPSRSVAAGTLDHIGFVVTEPAAIDGWRERARAFSVDVVQEVRDHRDGARSFYLRDPDGHVIQMLYHPPLSKLPAERTPELPRPPAGG